MSAPDIYEGIVEREQFLELIMEGVPPRLAGHDVGWTPQQTAKNMSDPEFAELARNAQEMAVDGIEKVLFYSARRGNLGAQQMILYNLRPEAWRDVRRIEVASNRGEISETVRVSTREAILEMMRTNGAAALQPQAALPYTGGQQDHVVVDAEVLDEQ